MWNKSRWGTNSHFQESNHILWLVTGEREKWRNRNVLSRTVCTHYILINSLLQIMYFRTLKGINICFPLKSNQSIFWTSKNIAIEPLGIFCLILFGWLFLCIAKKQNFLAINVRPLENLFMSALIVPHVKGKCILGMSNRTKCMPKNL